MATPSNNSGDRLRGQTREVAIASRYNLPWSWGSKIADQLILDALVSVSALFVGSVLDVGCGMKPYQQHLGARAAKWMGIDFQATASGPSRADVFGSAIELPFKTDSFDVVLSTQVLEHVPEPGTLIREAHRVLRPGGHMVLTAPQTNPLHEEPHDYFRFTCYGLRHLAELCGLEVLETRPLGGAIATVGQMVIWHMSWLRRIPAIGRFLAACCTSTISWLVWRADALSSVYGEGAMKDTIIWLLIARKS